MSERLQVMLERDWHIESIGYSRSRAKRDAFARYSPTPQLAKRRIQWEVRQPTQRRDVDVKRTFEALASAWHMKAAPLSSARDMALLPEYQQIIGLGYPAVPYILEDLRRTHGHWFWALRSITGENPVPREGAGNVLMMADAWLKWAEAKGL